MYTYSELVYIILSTDMRSWKKTCQSFSMMVAGREATMSRGIYSIEPPQLRSAPPNSDRYYSLNKKIVRCLIMRLSEGLVVVPLHNTLRCCRCKVKDQLFAGVCTGSTTTPVPVFQWYQRRLMLTVRQYRSPLTDGRRHAAKK